MPLLRRIVLLFACCFTFPLIAQEPARFVIPDDQPQVSFPAQVLPKTQDQLQHVAEGFRTSSPPQARPAPIQPASHTDYQAPPTISSASMGRNDTTSIQTAVLPPAPPQPLLEQTLVEPQRLEPPTEFEENPAVPQKPNILDTPLIRKGPSDAKGVAKPLFSGGVGPVVSMFVSLFLVLTTFLILALLFKKVSPKGSRPLPKELFENLGRAPLTQKFQLHLLRLGNRLILVSVTLDGVQPITEITDPDEVLQLLGLCRQWEPNSSTQNFKRMLNTLAAEPTEGGDVSPNARPRPRAKATSKSSFDLYSESNESLTELLANGLKGGRNG